MVQNAKCSLNQGALSFLGSQVRATLGEKSPTPFFPFDSLFARRGERAFLRISPTSGAAGGDPDTEAGPEDGVGPAFLSPFARPRVGLALRRPALPFPAGCAVPLRIGLRGTAQARQGKGKASAKAVPPLPWAIAGGGGSSISPTSRGGRRLPTNRLSQQICPPGKKKPNQYKASQPWGKTT